MMKKWNRIGLLLGLMCVSSASLANPPFNVDDPMTTEYRKFNLLVSYISSQSNGFEGAMFPNLMLSYGMTDKLEIGAMFGGATARFSGASRQWGASDTGLWARWRFQNETKNIPSLLLGYQIKLPTADANKGLGTGRADHGLWLATAKSFGRSQAFANLGYNILGNQLFGKDNLFWGVGLMHQLTETLIIGGQFYGNTINAPGGSDEMAWGLALIYNFAPNRSLLLQLGRSERGNADLNVFAGVNFVF